jgi:2-oxo-4-hydroxy-4-carboxy-5-ureidoimidazoline decarboxylase
MQKGVEKTSGPAGQPKCRTILEINALDAQTFVRIIGPVFEGSPWIAQRAWGQRPFADFDSLHRVLCQTVREASETERLKLIQAHPDLAGRLAQTGSLTAESAREQADAGLNALTTEETALFRSYNRRYSEKFGFPFILCARRNRKEAILRELGSRLNHSSEQEIQIALDEIFKIAELRLRDLVSPAPARLTTHVLDTVRGCPARDVQIELWSILGNNRTLLNRTRTNSDGRTEEPLATGDALPPGEYELIFFVGDYFEAFAPGAPRFLDQVPVRFRIANSGASYHVPLVCSPWAYSTYRGT